MKQVFLLSTALVIFAHTAAHTQETCEHKTASECTYLHFREVDKALNEKYKQIIGCLKTSSQSGKAFLEAQRAWIRFRDAECSFRAGAKPDPTTDQGKTMSACEQQITVRRAIDMNSYLVCDEGKTDCPTKACKFD